MPVRVTREQVMAFRLAGHNLAGRLPAGSLLEGAGACGIQNSPPGSAALALAARVEGLTPAELDRALENDRSLIQFWSLRGAPYIFPTRSSQVFTTGLLPEDEESLRFFVLGAGPALDKIGIGGRDVVGRTACALMDILDGRTLTFRQLSAGLTELVSRTLSPTQLSEWRSPSWYSANQSLGEAVIHFALRIVALEGLFCFAPREGNEASFLRTDQWLGAPLPRIEPDTARAELVRHYLRCYGPSTAEHFGEWAGIAPAAADRAWGMIEDELVEEHPGRMRRWVHRDDAECLESPPVPAGVRLLPPYDPFLQQRDRETAIPDRALQRRVWKRMGNPGVVLSEGEVVGIWRPQKRGKRLTLSVESFAALTEKTRDGISEEAAAIAPFRGCESVETVFVG